MRPRVKLVTPWNGPLPVWLPQYQARWDASKLFVWERFSIDLLRMNFLASLVSNNSPTNKETFYNAACDYRPLYRRMFAQQYEGYEWWGWCDVDVVFGDLDRLLGPLLDDHDVVTTAAGYLHGPLTLLRNTDEIADLWRSTKDYKAVLANPVYCNWDETGFGDDQPHHDNPSFSRMVANSGLRVHYDDRSWTETKEMLPGGAPSRGCELHGDKLVEFPTGRELVLYHFTQLPKQWPIPGRYADLKGIRKQQVKYMQTLPESTGKPHESPTFWAKRLAKAKREDDPIWTAILSTTEDGWNAIQDHTTKVVSCLLRDGDKVLDAGCGIGSLVECLKAANLLVEYRGVDYCPEMVAAAQAKYRLPFEIHDIKELPYADDSFDWVVCRGLEGTAKTLVSLAAWARMEREMLRVARRLLLIDSSMNYRVVER